MDIIRRNTDYALRAAVYLAGRFRAAPVGTKQLAQRRNIPYQLACKLLQRLHKAGIVESIMGPAGGFALCRNPSKINVRQVVEAVQGPLRFNKCLFERNFCRLSRTCPVNRELGQLQRKINVFLDRLTLQRLSVSQTKKNYKRRSRK